MSRLEKVQRRMAALRHVADTHDKANDGGVMTKPVAMSFESPDSSTIASARYDEKSRVMTIHFHRGRSDRTPGIYHYADFPLYLWMEFAQATSKGQFFTSRIRPVYTGEPDR